MNKYLNAISSNLLYFIISIIFFLVITPIAVKVMGDEFYGLWVILISIMLFSSVGNLGIGAIVMKFSAEAPDNRNSQDQTNQVMTAGFIIVFIMACLTALLLFITKNLIVENINTSTQMKAQFGSALLFIAASIFPQFLARVPHGYLLSQYKNQQVRQLEFLSTFSLWIGAILLTLLTKDLTLIAIWACVSSLIVFGLYYWRMKSFSQFKFQANMTVLRKMVNFSSFMFLESLAISLFQQVDKIIVSFTLGPGLAGVYSIGTSLALRLSMVTGQVTEVMIPYASLKASLNDQKKLYDTFRQLSRFISLVIAGISSFFIIWMNQLLSIWISAEYAYKYSDSFRLLILAYGLLSLCRPAHQTLTGLGKIKFTALVYLLSTVAMLIGVYLLSLNFGMVGAMCANFTMILLLLFNGFLYYQIDKNKFWKIMIQDNRWGLVIPVIGYGFIQFSPQTLLMLLVTIILESLLMVIFFKDFRLLRWASSKV